jgi:hypothetical protein
MNQKLENKEINYVEQKEKGTGKEQYTEGGRN